MAIFTVSITGVTNPVEVYGGSTALADYLGAAYSDGATTFRGLAADDQKRLLVAATRFIEQQYWQGTATGLAGGTPTTLSFPRTGLTDVNGSALDATNVPPQLVNAVFELVAILADDSSVQAATDAGSNVKALGAGSGRVEFFNPQTPQFGNATVLPTVVDRLVGRWLALASPDIAALRAGVASGLNADSDFMVEDDSGEWEPIVRDVRWPL